MLVDYENIPEGQILWYCNLDFYEVKFAKNHYNDGRILVRHPPNNIQCFTESHKLFISRRSAIDSLIERIASLEGEPAKEKPPIAIFDKVGQLFDCEEKNLSFNQLISSLDERLKKLEQKQEL